MNFANVKTWTIQEGEVIVVKDSNNSRIIWSKGSTPGPDYSEPFYVQNITNSNETLSIFKSGSNAPTITVEYSTDKYHWYTLGTTSTTALTYSLAPGNKLYLRANTTRWCGLATLEEDRINGVSKVGGNIMSLLYGSDFTGNERTFPTKSTYTFQGLFYSGTIIDASELLLPATTLTYNCYYSMFRSCTSLTTAPALPATTLATECYYMMFRNCTSLTTAPELPAITLAGDCYYGMFAGCSSLTTAPVLPATTLDAGCYSFMFMDCTSLTTAPELPVTTLMIFCYSYMFSGCTSLTTAPTLPATTTNDSCYSHMFSGCTSLTTAPTLPATTLSRMCYDSMFYGCTALTSAPELQATTLTDRCYIRMFYGCTSLNYVKCLATSRINTDNSTSYWLTNVSPTGTFVKATGITWASGDSGIPTGWTVQEV